MAFTRVRYGGAYNMPFNYSHFVCDELTDLTDLPTNTNKSALHPEYETCAIGSIAVVLEARLIYMLNNSNTWVVYKDLSAAASIVTVDGELDVATIGDIENYIT